MVYIGNVNSLRAPAIQRALRQVLLESCGDEAPLFVRALQILRDAQNGDRYPESYKAAEVA